MWNLTPNSNKSMVMVCQVSNSNCPSLTFTMDGDMLDVVPEYNYIGIPFTGKGSPKVAVTSLKANAAKEAY